jgi:hypothetical protein
MSDPKPKNPSIPQWQQPQRDASPDQPSTPSPNSDAPSKPPERSALLEQASKFLQDDSIRDAPTDHKISFLESKGLRNNEIQTVLGVSRNSEATSSVPAEDTNSSAQGSDDSNTSTPEEASTSPPPSSQTTQHSQTSASSPAPSQSPPLSSSPAKSPTSRDAPPIITYPEFLFKEPEKPPLVTFRGILYTLYGVAGLGAGVYGAGEYFVKPLLSNLTSARHEFAETTSENLKKLNEKLEQNVSTIPPQLSSRDAANVDGEEDAESVTSDPTELFHRDVATQTSPDVSQTPAPSSTENATPDPTATVSSHIQRVESIQTHLREFADQDKSSDADDAVRLRLSEMQHYLDGLMYSRPAYKTGGFGMYTSSMDTGSGAATGVARGEEDAISNFKSEIRGVKGALLSARNFPATRGGRISGGVPVGR